MIRNDIQKALKSEDKEPYEKVLNQLYLKEPKLSVEEAHFYIDEHFVAYAEALVNVKANAQNTLIMEDIRSYFFEDIDPALTPFPNYDETERDKIREFMKQNVVDDEF